MTYESRYEFMYMKNIVKSYLKSGNTKAPDVSGRGTVNPAAKAAPPAGAPVTHASSCGHGTYRAFAYRPTWPRFGPL